MINNALDAAAIRAALAARGRVQVEDYLQPDAAERLLQCLSSDVPWNLAIHDEHGFRTIMHEEYSKIPETEREQWCRRTAEGARQDGFRFFYDGYQMVEAYKRGRDPGLLLHPVLEFFNSPEHVAWIRHLTGEPKLRRVAAQASCFRRGHFLRAHDDTDRDEGRRYAFVINLCPRWQADWGGQLQFIDADGRVADSFLPRWNSLSLFRVPALHAVTPVAPWAQDDRYAISGWFLE